MSTPSLIIRTQTANRSSELVNRSSRLLAFGSPDAEGFTRDMGAELIALLAQVVERTAERWPVL